MKTHNFFTFNKTYLALAILIFVVEVIIAMYIHDTIIRPYMGDVLVVILIYCFLKAFLNVPVRNMAIFVLLFSFSIECLQYFSIVDHLGLSHNKIARIVIGTSFSWMDILAYITGIGLTLFVEKYIRRQPILKNS